MYQTDSREFRVFISSTFRDMHDERDHLNQVIFPEIRKLCWERGVNFAPVDLRWGINAEESSRGDTLRICLDEVEHSSPFFIGMLGQRYGWIPTSEQSGLAEEEQKNHYNGIVPESLLQERSVTEMEILCGVLKASLDKTPDAFFYFREESEKPEDECPESQAKLARLKDTIRTWAALNPITTEQAQSSHRLLDGYCSIEELGERIKTDLIYIINHRWPAGQVPSKLEQDRAKHLGFSQSRRQGYVADEAALTKLDNFLSDYSDNAQQMLIVAGESGLGKSSLLAEWAYRLQQQQTDYWVFEHYIGAYGHSSGFELVHRLLDELEALNPALPSLQSCENESAFGALVSGEKKARPTERHELRAYLIEQLALVQQPIILVLDALNQLDSDSQDLRWLPGSLPPHVKVVVSTISPEFGAEAEQKVWSALIAPQRRVEPDRTFLIQPLDEERLRAIIGQFSERYRKHFEPHQIERIAATSLAYNPLFLRSLLEEVRLYGRLQARDAQGVSNEITSVLDQYLTVQAVDDLFELAIANREVYFGRGLVESLLSLLLAARQGLTEDDLFCLLNDDITVPVHSMRDILAVLRAFDIHLSHKSHDGGLYHFFHGFIEKAVADRYQLNSSSGQRLAYHRSLAKYFDKQPMNKRVAHELPWQLQQLQNWPWLQQVLLRQECFAALYQRGNHIGLLKYWLDMPIAYRKQMGALYVTACNSLKLECNLEKHFCVQVAYFLIGSGCFTDSKIVLQHLLPTSVQQLGYDHPNTLETQYVLAVVLQHLGELGAARELYEKVLDLQVQALGEDHLDTLATKGGLAGLLQDFGEFSVARECYEQILAARIKDLGEENPSTLCTKSSLAGVLVALDDLTAARGLYESVLMSMTRTLGMDHPHTLSTQRNLAGLLRKLGELSVARELYEQVLAVEINGSGEEHPNTLHTQERLAKVLVKLGELTAACGYYEKILLVLTRTQGEEHPSTLIIKLDLARLLKGLGELSAASEHYEQVLTAKVLVLDKEFSDTTITQYNLACMLQELGELPAARMHYEHVMMVLMRTLGKDHQGTLATQQELARVLQGLGELAAARELYEQVVSVRTRNFGHENTKTLLAQHYLAEVLCELGDLTDARECYEQLLAVLTRIQGEQYSGTFTTQYNLARVLQGLGELAAARELYEQALAMQIRKLGDEHPDTIATQYNLAGVLYGLGELAAAREHYEQVLPKLALFNHPDTLTAGAQLALVLRKMGELTSACKLYLQVLDEQERALGADHPHTLITRHNLASALRAMGEFTTARELFEQVLTVQLRTLGDEHPQILTTKHNLASVMRSMGEFTAARELFEQVLKVQLRMLGDEHSQTLTTKHNLASVLWKIGELTVARKLLEQVLAVQTRTLGEEHSKTSTTRQHLASVLQAMEKSTVNQASLKKLFGSLLKNK